eukprot:5198209-Pyramimonas_sp.AAC.3
MTTSSVLTEGATALILRGKELNMWVACNNTADTQGRLTSDKLTEEHTSRKNGRLIVNIEECLGKSNALYNCLQAPLHTHIFDFFY